MDYDKAYTDRCKCGEPATIDVVKPGYAQTRYRLTDAPFNYHYCINCYAKKKANESIKQLTGARDD